MITVCLDRLCVYVLLMRMLICSHDLKELAMSRFYIKHQSDISDLSSLRFFVWLHHDIILNN